MLMSLVNPGVGETRARPSLPASRFSSEDLPTFERPMKANSGSASSGHESRSGALQSKMADEMFTMKYQPVTIAANRLQRYNHFARSWLKPGEGSPVRGKNAGTGNYGLSSAGAAGLAAAFCFAAKSFLARLGPSSPDCA